MVCELCNKFIDLGSAASKINNPNLLKSTDFGLDLLRKSHFWESLV